VQLVDFRKRIYGMFPSSEIMLKWCRVGTKRIKKGSEPAKASNQSGGRGKCSLEKKIVRHKLNRYENASQRPSGYPKRRDSSRIYVHRRKNPAAMAARTTVTPDLAAETAPLPERSPEAVEVGVGTTVLVVVMLDILEGSEP